MTARDLVEQLRSDQIGLEQFLWGCRDAGVDRRQAARLAVQAAATEVPGGRSSAAGATDPTAQLDSGTR